MHVYNISAGRTGYQWQVLEGTEYAKRRHRGSPLDPAGTPPRGIHRRRLILENFVPRFTIGCRFALEQQARCPLTNQQIHC